MDRAALAELDRAALIAIILRQQALIEQLTARLAELGYGCGRIRVLRRGRCRAIRRGPGRSGEHRSG